MICHLIIYDRNCLFTFLTTFNFFWLPELRPPVALGKRPGESCRIIQQKPFIPKTFPKNFFCSLQAKKWLGNFENWVDLFFPVTKMWFRCSLRKFPSKFYQQTMANKVSRDGKWESQRKREIICSICITARLLAMIYGVMWLIGYCLVPTLQQISKSWKFCSIVFRHDK